MKHVPHAIHDLYNSGKVIMSCHVENTQGHSMMNWECELVKVPKVDPSDKGSASYYIAIKTWSGLRSLDFIHVHLAPARSAFYRQVGEYYYKLYHKPYDDVRLQVEKETPHQDPIQAPA